MASYYFIIENREHEIIKTQWMNLWNLRDARKEAIRIKRKPENKDNWVVVSKFEVAYQ